MPYIDLAGLSRYASRQKERLERDYALLRDMQWTRSEKAGAVSLWPVGGTPLKPTVDFLFAETPPAEGDKGPDNPSAITGVSSLNVGRVGKNLLLRPDRPLSYTGYTLSFNADCSYSVNGSGSLFFSVTDGDAAVSGTPSAVVLDESKTYTLSVKLQSGSVGGQAYLTIGIPSGNAVVINLPQTAGTTAKQSFSGSIIPDGRFHCRINAAENGSFSNAVFFVQLEEGSSETAFEEPMSFSDANYTLPLGSTYYGGTLDVASGVMTVTWREKTLNGSEIVLSSTAGYLLQDTTSVYIDKTNLEVAGFIGANGYTNNIACAKFNAIVQATGTEGVRIAQNGNFTLCLNTSRLAAYGYEYGDSVADAVTAVKAWLADNNVTIFYRTTQPVSVSLTPTQILSLSQPDKYTPRLNTIYTDAQAVQVGYVKSPIRDEYELQQAVIAQGGNV